jgi:glucosamine-6-phosphate deaminase
LGETVAPSTFTYDLADFISFRDRQACQRVRSIRRDELTKHPNPDFRIRVIDDRAEFYQSFADDIVARIRAARDADEQLVMILPVGPVPQYELAVAAINSQRLSLSHVHIFNMDEYADENGNIAPEDWPLGFTHAMKKYFYNELQPKLRPPQKQFVGFTNANLNDYARMIEDAGGADICYSGPGWNGHLAFIEPDAL